MGAENSLHTEGMNRAARERSTELRVALHLYYDNQRVAKMRTLCYNITMIIIVIL